MNVEDQTAPPLAARRHYTVAEIAAAWNLGTDCVRKLFENEPGVVTFGAARSTGRKRRYMTLRVPEDVLERVHARLQVRP